MGTLGATDTREMSWWRGVYKRTEGVTTTEGNINQETDLTETINQETDLTEVENFEKGEKDLNSVTVSKN